MNATFDHLVGILHAALGPGDGTALVLGVSELATAVAEVFSDVVAVEPDPHLTPTAGPTTHPRVQWMEAATDEIRLAPGSLAAVFLGPSFRWMHRESMAVRLFEALVPGGHVVMTDELAPGPEAATTLPTRQVEELVAFFGTAPPPEARHRSEATGLDDAAFWASAGFVNPQHYVAQERGAGFQDVETVMGRLYARAATAPDRFGYHITEFDSRLRSLLAAHAVDGGFALPRPAVDLRIWSRP